MTHEPVTCTASESVTGREEHERTRERRRTVLVFWVVLELLGLGDLVVLVVAGDDGEAGVAPKPLDGLRHLLLDGGPKFGQVGRVAAASESEVLPDEEAKLILQTHEMIVRGFEDFHERQGGRYGRVERTQVS